jgi:hypothetical protein
VLKVQAEDGMGMTGSSIDNIVQIIIDHPAANPWQALYRNLPAIAGLSVLLLGAFLLLILIVAGRLRPATMGIPRKANPKKDPVTQPVRVRNEPAARRLSNPFNRLQWPQRHVVPTAQAFLSRLTEGDSVSAATPIPIIANEITIGSDPNLATLVLTPTYLSPASFENSRANSRM